MRDEEYIAAINAESERRKYTTPDFPLTAWTGPEVWLQAWRDDPTLTPAEQVANEIQYAWEETD